MAKKNRSEKNKRFNYIGTGAKYTIELNGDELNTIAGALQNSVKMASEEDKLTEAQFLKKHGFYKDNICKNIINKSKKILKDLNIEGMRGYSL